MKDDDMLLDIDQVKRYLSLLGYKGQISSDYILLLNARIVLIIHADTKLRTNRKCLTESL